MIFYRVDDIGIEAAHDLALLESLELRGVPYIAAVIPMRLSVPMARRLREYRYATIFQHGVTHISTARHLERDEFPDNVRSAREQLADGRARLENMIGCAVTGYAPPWNRVSASTLRLLEDLGFRWLSGHVRNHYLTTMLQVSVSVDPIRRYYPLSFYNINEVLLSLMLSVPLFNRVGIVFHPGWCPPAHLGLMVKLIRCTAPLSYSMRAWQHHLESHQSQ